LSTVFLDIATLTALTTSVGRVCDSVKLHWSCRMVFLL